MLNQHDPRGEELERFRPYLLVIARMHLDYRLRSIIDPEDAIQNVFEKCLQRWDQCTGSRKAWLRQSLLNHLKDLLKREKTQKNDVDRQLSLEQSSIRLESALRADESSPSQKAVRNEELEKLATALQKLPTNQQEVVILYHLHEMKLQHVASQLGITTGSAGGLAKRGLESLVRHLSFPE